MTRQRHSFSLLLEDGEAVPEATRVENWIVDPDYVSVAWALVDVDVALLNK